MNILQLVKCAVGRHSRSRALAWHDGDDYASWCTGCGCQMRRNRNGWRPAAHVRQPPVGHQKAPRQSSL